MMGWVALGLTVETGSFVAAAFIWLRSTGYTVAEAAAGAVILVLMGFSLIHQTALFTGSATLGLILEATALAAVLAVGVRRRFQLTRGLAAAADLLRHESLSGATLLVAWLTMAGLMVAGWLSAADHTPLFWVDGVPSPLITGGVLSLSASEPIPILNAPALFFHTTRFGLRANACGFGLLSHMALGCATYALARRYAWPPLALTVSLMVLSMPRLVFLALQPSAELLSTSAIVYAVLLIYRLIEQHRPADLRFFLLCILFSIDSNPMSIGLVPVMLLLLLVVMIRRHGWLLWQEMITTRPLTTVLVLLPAIALAQVPVLIVNLVHGHPLLGAAVPWDNDGILDALANLVRYLLVAVDPTEPIRQMVAWLVGLDLNRMIAGLYGSVVAPVFAHVGVQAPFQPVLSGPSGMSFGPFAFLLVLPAMAYALMRGPRRLKALTVAWMGYLYLASLVVSWQPGNIATMTPLLAANGFLVAFWLPPWRLRRRGMRLLQVDFALLLAWSLVVGWRSSG